MRAVLARSLNLYRRRNGGATPSLVVIHKTTPFKDDELAGAISKVDGGCRCAIDGSVEVNHQGSFRGVEKVVEISLNGAEQRAFDKSVASVDGLIAACKKIAPKLA